MTSVNPRRLIILDFDHTLFDTSRFINDLEDAFEAVGISKTYFQKQRSELKKNQKVFDFNKMAVTLQNKIAIDPHKIVENILKKNGKNYIFSDVNSFIQNHKNNFDFMILTQGDQNLQTKKLKYSGFEKFPALITMSSKIEPLANLVNEYDQVYFIDDRATHIDEVKERFPNVITFLIKRPEDSVYGKNDQSALKADLKIQDLNFTI